MFRSLPILVLCSSGRGLLMKIVPSRQFFKHLWVTDPECILIKVTDSLKKKRRNKYSKLDLNHRGCNRSVCKAY